MKYLTYQDVVDHLIAASFGGPQDAEQRDIRTATQRAYTELAFMRDWRYYTAHARVLFNQAWEGEVTYDNDTGIFTIESGDPWPLWAAEADIRIGTTYSRVGKRLSNTQIQVDPRTPFPRLITEAEPAVLHQSMYRLPDDFRNIDTPLDQSRWSHFTFVSPDTAMKIEASVALLQGPPHTWTVIKHPLDAGWVIKVLGYPITVQTLDFTYRRTPRPLRVSGHEARTRQGTISVSGTTVTGSGTAFDSSMVGSVLRVGTASAHPDTLGSLNPYVAESIIQSVASGTSLTISTSMTHSNVKYVVTDIIDMPETMHNALLSCAEYWLARMRGAKPDNAFAMYQRDMRLALEGDQIAPLEGTPRTIYDTGRWRTTLVADNALPDTGPIDGGTP